MLITLRNFIVNILAACIRDRDDRHNFRNKYKRRTKFRKLRDDNRRLFHENRIILNELNALKAQLQADTSIIFRVEPIDNSPPQGPDSEVYLCIACVAKNEGPYLREWIEYHKLVGVERFYFYDNESDDNTKEVLSPYIKDGSVVYHFLPNHPITNTVPQMEAYGDAVFKYRSRVRWMALIDIDEFIVPVEKDSIAEFLTDYEQFPAVAINWLPFDSNGHEKKPKEHGGLVTANYTRVRKNQEGPQERMVKSIVNPKFVVNITSPHYAVYYKNRTAVTENFEVAKGGATAFHSTKKIRVNHYRTKSREEYIDRVTKNQKGNSIGIGYKLEEENLNFKGDTTEDFVIQRFVPQLKRILKIQD